MKKFFTFLFAVMATVSAFAYTAQIDGIYYNVYDGDNPHAEVTYYAWWNNNKDAYQGDITIPSSITYSSSVYPVTTIGNYAFMSCTGLTSVSIPNSVTSIGGSAFSGCTGLTSISIPNSVTRIENYAFSGCNKLTEPIYTTTQFVFLPKSYEGAYTIPNGITAICGSAFDGCTGLTSISIPNSVTSIGSSAFSGCSNLDSVYLPNTITEINSYTFSSCSKLSYICLPFGLTDIGDGAFSHCGLRKVNISGSVQTIGQQAFQYCSNLSEITFMYDACPAIEAEAFDECHNLATVHNHSSLMTFSIGSVDKGKVAYYANSIDNNVNDFDNFIFEEYGDDVVLVAYRGSSSNLILPENYNGKLYAIGPNFLTTKTLDENSGGCSVGYWDSNSGNWITTYHVVPNHYVTSVTIPASVSKLFPYAFSASTFSNSCYQSLNLKTVLFEQGSKITTIPTGTFDYCYYLTSVNIPNSVTSIGEKAFNECHSLTEVTIPSNLNSISQYAFWDCSSLTSVTIPSSVTSIGERAFYGTSLDSIVVEAGNKTYDSRDNCYALIETATNTLLYGTKRTTHIPTSIAAIADNALRDINNFALITCDWETPATIGSYVVSSSDVYFVVPDVATYRTAWKGYESHILSPQQAKTEVSISALSDKSALHQAMGLDSLKSVIGLKINGTINSYDIMMIRNQMPKLRLLDLSDARIVANAYQYTDGYCSKNDTLTAYAFTGTGTKIATAVLPKNIKVIEPNTFNTYLKDLTICGGAVADKAFYGCSNLNSVVLAEGVSSVGSSAFAYCSNIKSVVIPSTLTTIPAETFRNCSNLRNVTFAGNIQAIGKSAFANCSVLSKITFAGDVKDIGSSAFEYCACLDTILFPESLETIGTYAFRGTSLKEITIPANVRSIGSYAFEGRATDNSYYSYYSYNNSSTHWKNSNQYNGTLQKVVIPTHSRLTEIAEGTFVGNTSLKDLSILGDSIAYIGWGAFAGCGMDTLVLPPHLTALSTLSFGYCDKLKYIAMPNSLTKIADNAFVGCRNLDNVQFPVKLTSIGHHAFADCTTLRNVDIPGLVTEIGDYAFKDCQVQSVYSYLFDPFTIGQNTFSPYANANATLYIPNVEDTEMKYLYDTQWSQFLSRVRMDKNFEYKDFYANGDVIIGDNDDPLNGDPNANLEPGSGLIVEEGENGQHLGTVTITGEPGDWASLIAGCNLHVDSLRLVIKVQKNCWHFHGFPFDIPLENLHADGKYVIYEYDGQTRAERDTTGWKRLPKEQKHLKRGHGYIFNFNASGSLVITIATPNFCNMLEKIMLFFYPAAKNNNKSWNYAANPFFAYYSLNDLNFTGPVTFWDAVNRTYRSYRPGDDDYYLSPYEGFFLQNEKDEEFELTFDKTKTKTKNQKEEAQANGHRMSAKQSSDNSRAIINLTLSGEDCSDDTRVVINPAARLTYDLGMDAQKFFSTDNVPQIYSLDADQLPCAINERPIGDGVINLGLKLPAAGQYTIDATRMDQTLYLLDREKNTLHTFADGAYTFSAPAGTLPARFALVEHYEAPTGIGNTADGRIEQTATGLYIHGTADIQIYSMTGIELCNGTCSGAIELPTGVYTLVCNGQPSKVVIK